MKLFTDVDANYATKRDYKHLSRHNQRQQPVAIGPSPTFLLVIQAITLAVLFAIFLQ